MCFVPTYQPVLIGMYGLFADGKLSSLLALLVPLVIRDAKFSF